MSTAIGASVNLANPAGLWALAAAVPILLLHVLRPRRPRTEVSSILLWRAVARPVSSASPWQRLRWSALLALQLLAVLLLALAMSRPVRTTTAPLSAHTVFVIDGSGSMAAADGSPDRIAKAREAARSLRSQLPEGGVASVVLASATPEVLLASSADRGAFDAAIDRATVTAGPAHWEDTFNLAASMETPGRPVGIVLIGDGGLSTVDQKAIPAGTSYVKVGGRSTNRAITSLTAEIRPGGLRAHVTVRNTGGPAADQTVRVDVDSRTRASFTVRIPSGRAVDRSVDVPAGDRVEAFLEGEDLLASDNHAFAVGAVRRPLKILVAGPADPYLDEVLASLSGTTLVHAPDSRAAPGYDLAVYDQVAVPADPGAPFLAIAPPGGAPGIVVTGSVDAPALTTVSADAVLSGLDLSDVAIAAAQKLDPGTAEVLVAADSTPLLLRGSTGGRAFGYLAFPLADSNLPLQVAFPLLVDRIVADLAGVTPGTTQVRVGELLPVDASQALVAVRPRQGGTIRRPAGGAAPVADRPGFWTIRQTGRPDRLVAVNADPVESSLAPAERLPIPVRPPVAGSSAPAGERSLLPFVIAALLLVLVAEWRLARRHIGVSRSQWRVGALLRVAIVAMLVGALTNLSLPRRGNSVSTLFLVDGSDSLGPGGRAAALAWVRDALAARGSGSAAGVAIFGGDARVEQLVDRDASLGVPTVQIDRSRTNAAGALRLSSALLPPASKRRVVLVSDGRFTDGDITVEAQRLAAEGIPVDVHAVVPAAGSDAAVASVDVPGRVGKGERFTVRAVVKATGAGTATIRVLRDDGSGTETTVDVRTLTLAVGDNVVDVDQVADKAGVARYRVVVESAGDAVPENDTGYAAVETTGPPRVLVAEGANGEGDAIVAALRSTGVTTEQIAAADLPGVERLAAYQAIVLVDADARTLAPAQVQALGSATRDLGRGLVVIGGERAYALGGYRGTDLEALLPVESEIRDPLRKKSVAEVLAIDTSGSMSACHCAGGNGIAGGGNRAEGGVNKTDISRSAAARSIAALSAGDQVGVLAFNTEHRWIIDLQKLPAEDVIRKGLEGLVPAGNTDLSTPLLDAGEKLRKAKATLKHIILFTDGFTSTGSLAGLEGQAGRLAAEGITVSVVATGEGSAAELGKVAAAGRGRFYPGTDLLEIPQIMTQETVLVARNFVNEGSFVPEVTAAAAPVRAIRAAPPLLGYVATTAKSTAETWLRVGPERDPLLASWRAGLGRVTAWTSDASARWSQGWARWDGYAAFWAGVVRNAFPLSEGATVRAEVRAGRLQVRVDGEGDWPDGASGSVRVTGPDGVARVVPLERTGAGTLAAEIDASQPGTYSLGAQVFAAGGDPLTQATGLATRSYAAEYEPGRADARGLLRVSALTKGRGSIEAADAFDPTGLRSGATRWHLAGLLLVLAVLLWPFDVAVRRLSLRRAGLAAKLAPTAIEQRLAGLRRRMRERADLVPAASRPASPQASPIEPPVVAQPSVTWRPTDARTSATDGSPADGGVTVMDRPAGRVRPVAPPRSPASGATLDQLLANRRARRPPSDGRPPDADP